MQNYYHIYNRGVDKRKIFMDEKDYENFLHRLHQSNDKNYSSTHKIRCEYKRDEYADILAYVLMPNHFHLFVQEREGEEVWRFLSRVLNGYTKYFNKKHERSGRLFESKYKSKIISSDGYFFHISKYIHLNPLSLIQKDWKKVGIKNQKSAMLYLESYPWSSIRSYLDLEQNILINPDHIPETNKPKDYRQFLQEPN